MYASSRKLCVRHLRISVTGYLSIEYEGREECKFACTRAIKNVRELMAAC